MAFRLGLRIAGIVYGNGTRCFSESISCLYLERNIVLDLSCSLPHSILGRASTVHLSWRCHAPHTIPAKANKSEPVRAQGPKRRQKSSATSTYISAVEISFRPPYYQDGSNLRVPVNPQLVVSPAICRYGKDRYAKRAEGPIFASGSAGEAYKLWWMEEHADMRRNNGMGECGAHTVGWRCRRFRLFCLRPGLLPLQRDSKQHVLRRLDLDHLRLRQHVVARAHLAPKLGLPVRHVPLEPPERDDARLLDGDDAGVLGKHVLRPVPLAVPLPHVDPVCPPGLEQERHRLAAHEEQAALGVVGRRLEQVQVVQLAQALVHAPAQPAHRHNVRDRGSCVPWRGGGRCANPLDGLGEVCRVLIWVVDDLCRLGACSEVLPCLGCEGVQIAYYGVQVVLGLVSIRRDISR